MTKEEQAITDIKKTFSYDLDKVLKNYLRKSATEIKAKYKAVEDPEERKSIMKFIDDVGELMGNDLTKLVNEYLQNFENNI